MTLLTLLLPVIMATELSSVFVLQRCIRALLYACGVVSDGNDEKNALLNDNDANDDDDYKQRDDDDDVDDDDEIVTDDENAEQDVIVINNENISKSVALQEPTSTTNISMSSSA
jgi:hypothetical protein